MKLPPTNSRNTAKFNFTKKSVTALFPPSDKPSVEYSDAIVTGLRLCVYKSGTKAFHQRYVFDGKKGSLRIGEFPGIGVEEARKIATEIRAQVDRGIDPKQLAVSAPVTPHFANFFEQEYLPHSEQHKRSHAADESKYRVHLKAKFGHMLLTEIRQADINNYLLDFAKTHRPATRNRHHMLLRSVFNLAVEMELIEANPCQKVKQVAENNIRRDFMTKPEMTRFFKALAEESNVVAASAIEFIALTALRRNEALTAKWNAFDPVRKQLHLPVTKNGKERYVPLSDDAVKVIERMKRYKTGEYIFPGKDSTKPLNNPTKCLKRVLKAAGITSDLCIHSLRHNWASQAVMSGVPMYDVKELLGHSNIASTQRYAHLSQQHLHDRTNAISKFFQETK